ncbi:unnamed protein product, partial [Mesorhabditis belari]|uniref:Uncharacterized protein n=1 Tax=Mesorhabditis belari TaxID=2138241 RepID=A0AAF3FGF3_9BILA
MGASCCACSAAEDQEIATNDFGFVPSRGAHLIPVRPFDGSTPIAKPERFTENLRQRSRESEASTDKEGGDIESMTGVGVALHQTDTQSPEVGRELPNHPAIACGDEVNDCGDCD